MSVIITHSYSACRMTLDARSYPFLFTCFEYQSKAFYIELYDFTIPLCITLTHETPIGCLKT